MLVSSPEDMRNLGIKSIFQSLARPYFFHGSSAALWPYFLKSYERSRLESHRTVEMVREQAYSLQVDRRGLSVFNTMVSVDSTVGKALGD